MNILGGSSRAEPSISVERAKSRETVKDKCEGRDLNPYVLLRQNLNLVRLPIPPPSRVKRTGCSYVEAAHSSSCLKDGNCLMLLTG